MKCEHNDEKNGFHFAKKKCEAFSGYENPCGIDKQRTNSNLRKLSSTNIIFKKIFRTLCASSLSFLLPFLFIYSNFFEIVGCYI